MAACERCDAIEEGPRAERAADRLAAAKRHDERRRRFADDLRGNVSATAFDDRRRRDASVVAASKMGAKARPASVFGALTSAFRPVMESSKPPSVIPAKAGIPPFHGLRLRQAPDPHFRGGDIEGSP
jgi:hypothetical protein